MTELRRRGAGARLTLRQGTYVNRGDVTGVQFTVYAPNKEGRAAASAAAGTAALLAP